MNLENVFIFSGSVSDICSPFFLTESPNVTAPTHRGFTRSHRLAQGSNPAVTGFMHIYSNIVPRTAYRTN